MRVNLIGDNRPHCFVRPSITIGPVTPYTVWMKFGSGGNKKHKYNCNNGMKCETLAKRKANWPKIIPEKLKLWWSGMGGPHPHGMDESIYEQEPIYSHLRILI